MASNERVGLGFFPNGVAASLDLIARAEAAGLATAWAVMPPTGVDTPTLLAAAATRTGHIRLGTAIVPAFVQHPLKLASQALAIEELAPGRLRLGIGTNNPGAMVDVFHLPFERPLARLREYLHVLRTVLGDGEIAFAGEFYATDVTLAAAPRTPVLIAAIGPHAFALAGTASDGAISWNCPMDYLVGEAVPAMARGAGEVGRSAPPLVAHVPVAVGTDLAEIRARARRGLALYAGIPFYARMFASAGFPVGADGGVTDALIDDLVVGGDEAAIAAGLRERLSRLGPKDELLVELLAGPDRRAEEDALLRALGEV